jgi:hypothetical protein
MKSKFIITFTISIALMQACLAQTLLNYGAELGLSFSHFPQKDSYNIGTTDYVTTKTNPLISPIIGLNGQMKIKKHFQLTLGIQYQMIGTSYYYHRDGRVPRDPGIPASFTYTSDELEKQTYHKLCLPLTIGFILKIGKIQPSVFIGVRPNLFLAGRYYSKFVFDATDNSQDQTIEIEYDPLDSKQTSMPLKQFDDQLLYGLSVCIGQHFKISLSKNSGKQLYYSESSISCFVTSFYNRDYNITLIYFLKPLTQKQTIVTGNN